jgi:DNA polymerase I-like protein with 3'-5' exonuclease and polymerase domains
VTQQGKVLFVDVETIGNNPRRDELLMTGWRFDGVTRMDLGQPGPELQSLLLDRAVVKASHTIYDAGWLRHEGTWHDTRTMAWSVNENTPLDLDWLLEHYCGMKMDKRLRPVSNRIIFLYRDPDGYECDWDLADYHEWPEVVKQDFIDYCVRDVDALAMLYGELGRGLATTEQLDYWLEEEVPYTSICIEMERNGLPINLDEAAVLATELHEAKDVSQAKLRKLARLPAVFKLSSPDQLSEYLFKRWFQVKDRIPITKEQRTLLRQGGEQPGLIPKGFEVVSIGTKYLNGHWVLRGRGLTPTPLTKRKLPNGEMVEGKHPSTATPDLMYIHANDPWVRELCLVHRRLDRLLTSYLDKFPRVAVVAEPVVPAGATANGQGPLSPSATTRIHGRYNQGGTVTGRLSSSDPNLQNIPSRHEYGDRIRALFQGRFVIGDYDALEMRIMAHLSGDPELIRIFLEGLDPHERTAVALFGACDGHDDPRRGIGKTVNYGVGYGAGPRKLAQVLSLEGYATTQSEAKEYLKAVQGFYKKFFRWSDQQKYLVKQTGGINTMAGRRRHLKGAFEAAASWKATQYGERQTVNSAVQGSAADIIRRGMLEVRRQVSELDPLAQIHDEAIWQYDLVPSPEVLARVQRIMETPFDMKVPLIFEPYVCDNWAQKGEGIPDLELLEEEAKKL